LLASERGSPFTHLTVWDGDGLVGVDPARKAVCERNDMRIRETFARAFARGSINVSLRFARGSLAPSPRLNPAALEAALDAAAEAARAAEARGLDLARPSLGEILGLRGVVEAETLLPSENTATVEAVGDQIGPLAAALAARRAAEGAGVGAVLAARLDEIEGLIAAARQTAEARAGHIGDLLRARVEALVGAAGAADPARLEQELALLAGRADVAEELDRLEGHVAAARDLLAGAGPTGRKLDFLTQEFNREANTLCAKANDSDLGALGLQMKVAIDQMREQVQNVE